MEDKMENDMVTGMRCVSVFRYFREGGGEGGGGYQ